MYCFVLDGNKIYHWNNLLII